MNMCEKRAVYNTESSTAPSSFSLHFRGTNAHKSTQTGRETDRQTDRQNYKQTYRAMNADRLKSTDDTQQERNTEQ